MYDYRTVGCATQRRGRTPSMPLITIFVSRKRINVIDSFDETKEPPAYPASRAGRPMERVTVCPRMCWNLLHSNIDPLYQNDGPFGNKEIL
ncbi:hypothetical protein EVAR_31224_1 [Eumeta japonica]|uniref:Uncharacterized protein n=1 Tax=Eumeta variegata TaxID=151549 RepID=A0A4C1VZR8_EUMVA|nr:hypothetical protein EVAR_31224_1 [Eumeta japonica]